MSLRGWGYGGRAYLLRGGGDMIRVPFREYVEDVPLGFFVMPEVPRDNQLVDLGEPVMFRVQHTDWRRDSRDLSVLVPYVYVSRTDLPSDHGRPV